MTARQLLMSARFQVAAAALAGMLVASTSFAVSGLHVVSQAGREFRPREITIKRGEIVQVVNDDGDLLHHVYIDSDQLQFDSGDQKPGSRTNITFSAAGNYSVLCAIHPKMKLVVRVE